MGSGDLFGGWEMMYMNDLDGRFLYLHFTSLHFVSLTFTKLGLSNPH